MATAEGTFPKVGNDPVYASEVNKFAGAGQFLGIGSFPTISSGTDLQNCGSIFIPAGSLSNPANILIQYGVTKNANDFVRIQVSGIGMNATNSAGSVIGNAVGTVSMVFGSPMQGFMNHSVYSMNETNAFPNTEGKLNYSTSSLSNVDPGSNLVIIFRTNAHANHTITAYSVQSFRGRA